MMWGQIKEYKTDDGVYDVEKDHHEEHAESYQDELEQQKTGAEGSTSMEHQL